MTTETGPRTIADELLDIAPIGLAVVEASGRVVWSNPAFAEWFAVPRGDRPATPPEDGAWTAVRRLVARGLGQGKGETVRDLRVGPESAPRYVDLDIVPLGRPGSAPGRVALFARDVSATFAERTRERLFYTAFRTSTNPMEATDARGILLDVNPAFERIYGYRREELVGRRPNVVRSSYTPPEVYRDLWGTITDPKRGSWSGEILNRAKDGRERPVLLTITAVRDPEGAITNYLGVAVDLSERRAWEAQAAHGDKLASLGQLAAGVAHEINTPLANVMLLTESMRRRTTDEWMRSRLATVTEQIEIAARIVRGLLDFARRSAPQPGILDLRDVARDAVEFVQGKRPRSVELALDLGATPVTVEADRGQLLQVATNLMLNAFDSVGARGTVRVAVGAAEGSGTLSVSDSGPGIPPEAMPHLFEPFFTTKAEGKGTGLGLAICHGIVRSHHGTITAANRPEGGAVFRVLLPLRGA